jgi:DNA-binding NtrC family response regulator
MPQRRILFVDDDEGAREVLGDFLVAEGYLIETARDGREALLRLVTFPADLVVTDLEMPGMNGLDLGRSLRRERPWCPVLLVTGHENRDLEIRAMGFECLKKPLDLAELAETLARLSATAGQRSHRGHPLSSDLT